MIDIKRLFLKLSIVLIVFIIGINKVYAYYELEYKEFEDYMNNNSYEVSSETDGLVAKKYDDNGIIIENYKFREFNTEEEALKYIKESQETQKEELDETYEYAIEEEFNTVGDKEESYSYIISTTTYKPTGKKYYSHLFRNKNAIITASCDYEFKENVKKNIEELFKDREKPEVIFDDKDEDTVVIDKNIVEKDKNTNKNSKKDSIILTTIAIATLILIILLIALIIKKHKQKNTDKK